MGESSTQTFFFNSMTFLMFFVKRPLSVRDRRFFTDQRQSRLLHELLQAQTLPVDLERGGGRKSAV